MGHKCLMAPHPHFFLRMKLGSIFIRGLWVSECLSLWSSMLDHNLSYTPKRCVAHEILLPTGFNWNIIIEGFLQKKYCNFYLCGGHHWQYWRNWIICSWALSKHLSVCLLSIRQRQKLPGYHRQTWRCWILGQWQIPCHN